MLLGQKIISRAIEFFEYNVATFPESANVYDSLGEGLEANNQYQAALENYSKAVTLGEKNLDVNLPVYQSHVERVQNKM